MSFLLILLGLLGLLLAVIGLLFGSRVRFVKSRKKAFLLGILSFVFLFIGVAITDTTPTLTSKDQIPSLDTYKNQAKQIPYKDLARNADSTYKGSMIHFSGKVIQLVDGEQKQIRVDVTDYKKQEEQIKNAIEKGESPPTFGESEIILVFRNDDAGNLLENDQIEIYGIVKGPYTYTAWTGVKYTIPAIESHYIILKEPKKSGQ